MTAVDERSKAAEIEAAERALSDEECSLGKHSPQLCPRLDEVASLYLRDGLYAKAELLYRRAVDILAKESVPEHLVQELIKLGMLYRFQGKLDDAESVYLRTLAAVEPLEDNARLRAERLCCLAGLYVEKQQFAQAQELLQKSTAAYQAAFGQHSCFSRLCCMALAVLCKQGGNVAQADEYFERSRTDVSSEGTGQHGDERVLLELIQNYYAQGRLAEAELLLAGSVYSDEERLWPEDPRTAQIFEDRAELFRAQGRYEDAELCFRRSLDIRLRVLGPRHPEVAESAMSLSTMYMSQNRCSDAEAPLKIALRTRVQVFGVENPGVAACIETYAALLKRTKRGAIAAKLEACARDIRSRLSGKQGGAGSSGG
jgi:tetratricopeptide (TPR) repeat protein